MRDRTVAIVAIYGMALGLVAVFAAVAYRLPDALALLQSVPQ